MLGNAWYDDVPSCSDFNNRDSWIAAVVEWRNAKCQGVRYNPQSNFDKLVKILEDEPIFPRSVFEAFGFWGGLKHTIWLICHPYLNAKTAAAGFRNTILRKMYIRSTLS
jgi:hypothetical protein